MTCFRGSNDSIGALSLSSSWLCFFYMLASLIGIFCPCDGKYDYWPLGTPNLLQEEQTTTLSPRVHLANSKERFSLTLLKSCVHFCQRNGAHNQIACYYNGEVVIDVMVTVNNPPRQRGMEGMLFSKRKVTG